MVAIEQLMQVIKESIDYFAGFKITYGDVRYQKLYVDEKRVYQLKLIGWKQSKRVYGLLIDIEIIDDLAWIHYDGTEYGIARMLEEKGIPKEQIVLGWLSPYMRQYSDYAKV